MLPSKLPASEEQLHRVKGHLKIAEKVRTGEYFREARGMFDVSVNDPMAERYTYVFITCCSLVILLIAVMAVQGLYPLQTAVPLTYFTRDLYEDIPHIKSLQSYKNEDPSESLLRFLVKNYVMQREEYDISTFDRDVNGVKSQTSESAFAEFQRFIDPHNPESPITVYQRHSKRKIAILSTRRVEGGMEVLIEASVDSRTDVKKSHWRVNMSFNYSGVELDDKSDTMKPMNFIVTAYHSKRLQDIK